jgi:hypothetical protein
VRFRAQFDMASRSLRQAEKKALDGANESQDTLLVAHYLMMDYGVGLVSVASLYLALASRNLAALTFEHCVQRSSSPAAAEIMPLPSPKRSIPPRERSSKNG